MFCLRTGYITFGDYGTLAVRDVSSGQAFHLEAWDTASRHGVSDELNFGICEADLSS